MNNALIVNGSMQFEDYVELNNTLHNPMIVEVDLKLTTYGLHRLIVLCKMYKLNTIIVPAEIMPSTIACLTYLASKRDILIGVHIALGNFKFIK
jgi:lipid A disaccharide synthetase